MTRGLGSRSLRCRTTYPPTIVQFANAALGPPVYIAKPKSTGRPETKFMVMYVAAQLSKSPRWRKNSDQRVISEALSTIVNYAPGGFW